MIVTLQTQRVQTLEQVRRVAEGNEPVDFALAERASAYEFIGRTLVQFDYAALGKADKGAVKAYLGKMTGLYEVVGCFTDCSDARNCLSAVGKASPAAMHTCARRPMIAGVILSWMFGKSPLRYGMTLFFQ